MSKLKKENNVIFHGKSRWVNESTGEIIETDEIIKKTSRNGFMITYLTAIIQLLDSLGNKKMQVVKYILENMEKANNSLIITTRELSEKSGVSIKTVVETLKILEDAKIIARKTGAIMVHPDLLHRGSENKQRVLLTRFAEFED